MRRTRFWRLAKYFNSRPSARGDPFALASAAICSYFNSRPSARGDCRRAPPTRRSPLFQFTPLREGRPHGDAVIMPIAPFQFTPLREGRPTCPAAEMMQGISIHAPPRGATIRPHQCCQICQFQFTPLREGRLRCCFQLLLIVLFQFTPLREGRRTHRDIITAGRDISIHAPPRGATANRPRNTARKRYFNSRPSARGDPPTHNGRTPLQFQFTPLREGRPRPSTRRWPTSAISIHAPPRGATRRFNGGHLHLQHFNSRPSARGDGGLLIEGGIHLLFQFTPLREGRPQTLPWSPRWMYFNSRPSARGDRFSVYHADYRRNFNSRPSARGDGNIVFLEGTDRISIHAPPRGATCRRHRVRGRGHFNSRPSARGDVSLWQSTVRRGIFQFTPLREGRRYSLMARCTTARYFNSRPSARGDTIQRSSVSVFGISIHAPPRGATSVSIATKTASSDFNSRPSARGDSPSPAMPVKFFDFNSRPSARGDADNRFDFSDCLFYFNSRPSARGDEFYNNNSKSIDVFQFTPLREGRHAK